MMVLVWSLLLAMTARAAGVAVSGDVGIEATGEGQLCERIILQKKAYNSDGEYLYDEVHTQNYIGMGAVDLWANPYASIFTSVGYSYIGCLSAGEAIQGPHISLQSGRDGFITLKGIYAGVDDLGKPKSIYGEYVCALALGGKISDHVVLKANALAGCEKQEKPINYSLTLGLTF
jgi:hypothetical protein